MSSTPPPMAVKDQPVNILQCKDAWEKLTAQEKKYAHHMSQASWWGSRIVLTQTSSESPLIFGFLQALWGWGDGYDALLAGAQEEGEDMVRVVEEMALYSARFYGNMGNYTSFGDAKFVPASSPASVKDAIGALFSGTTRGELETMLDGVEGAMWDESPGLANLGFAGESGVSAYYGEGVEKADVELVQSWMDRVGVSAYNTRLFAGEDGVWELRIASSEVYDGQERDVFPDLVASADEDGCYAVGDGGDGDGPRIRIVFGDHAPWLGVVVEHLKKAKVYAANPTQKAMIAEYIRSFSRGSIADHVQSQIHWVGDVGPVVETNIGFIESYRDPAGVRGEWEGMCAIVNKERSAKFDTLVDSAPDLIAKFPWDPLYEKDTFNRPDFTSLEVVSFASSGIPAGINIPNYDDVRANVGFKNVSLGNVLSSASIGPDKISLVADQDQDLYRHYVTEAFEVQVGIHELLGHGSGKLLGVQADGSLNFDPEAVDVKSWYAQGETWSSKFGSLSSAMEECRAEACGLYLCVDPEVLSIFGHQSEEEQAKIVHANWLSMVRAGLRGLEFYSPDAAKWRQAHMHARHVLLRVLLEAGGGLVSLVHQPELQVVLDPSKIDSVGIPAIGAFLAKLQEIKATGNVAEGVPFFEQYSGVDASWLDIRDRVLAVKKTRAVFVQAHTQISQETGTVDLVEFPGSPSGLIASMTTRFPVPSPEAQSNNVVGVGAGLFIGAPHMYAPMTPPRMPIAWSGAPNMSPMAPVWAPPTYMSPPPRRL